MVAIQKQFATHSMPLQCIYVHNTHLYLMRIELGLRIYPHI